ncbi:MAG: amidohydrolase [Candidatus Bathyarchaeia archaeon]|jgi:cytosine/adenosine deaminase-related metal-dependent hydrolase
MASILISGGTIITIDDHRQVIRDGAVLVENDRIAKVGKADQIKAEPRAEFEINAKGMVVLPGLIDTHVHLAQALLRGCADDTFLIDWLQKFVWPLQGNFDAQDGKVSAELCMLEMIKSGTTTFLESLLHSRYGFDGIAEAVDRAGMRGILSKTVMGLPGYGSENSIMHPGMIENAETCLREVETHFKRWNGKADDRIRVWYGARSLGGCTPELYAQIAEGARLLGTGITIHLSEVQEDVRYTKKEFGKMPAELMDEVGLVGPNVVFAHGVWLTENEWQILARKGANVAHCPSSNMKLSSGIAKVPEMMQAGVNVGIGCDGGPSNNSYDMIREMKTASLLQKVRTMDPLATTAETVLEMATINGAKALGLQDQIGSIETGKKADLVIVNMQKPHLTPTFNPVSHLVYAAEGSDVETTIIDGKIVMENRVVKSLNEEKIIRDANEHATKLLKRAEIDITPKWTMK